MIAMHVSMMQISLHSVKFLPLVIKCLWSPGGHLLERVIGWRGGRGGAPVFRSHFFTFCLLHWLCFSHVLSALSLIFRFLSIPGHNVFIFSLEDYQNGVENPFWRKIFDLDLFFHNPITLISCPRNGQQRTERHISPNGR